MRFLWLILFFGLLSFKSWAQSATIPNTSQNFAAVFHGHFSSTVIASSPESVCSQVANQHVPPISNYRLSTVSENEAYNCYFGGSQVYISMLCRSSVNLGNGRCGCPAGTFFSGDRCQYPETCRGMIDRAPINVSTSTPVGRKLCHEGCQIEASRAVVEVGAAGGLPGGSHREADFTGELCEPDFDFDGIPDQEGAGGSEGDTGDQDGSGGENGGDGNNNGQDGGNNSGNENGECKEKDKDGKCKDSNGQGNGNGNNQCKESEKVNGKCPEGTGNGNGNNQCKDSEKDKDGKCPQGNGTGGRGNGQFSGNCDSQFKCTGDALQCAIALEIHKRNCQLYAPDKNPDSFFNRANEGRDSNSAAAMREKPQVIDIEQLNREGYGWPRSCPADPRFELGFVRGYIVIPFSLFCSILKFVSDFGLALTALALLMWLVSERKST